MKMLFIGRKLSNNGKVLLSKDLYEGDVLVRFINGETNEETNIRLSKEALTALSQLSKDIYGIS